MIINQLILLVTDVLLVPKSRVQESGHLTLQSRVGLAVVLIPAGVTVTLLAYGFNDEFVFIFVGGVVSVVDYRHVNLFFLVVDGFGANFGIGSGVHHLIMENGMMY